MANVYRRQHNYQTGFTSHSVRRNATGTVQHQTIRTNETLTLQITVVTIGTAAVTFRYLALCVYSVLFKFSMTFTIISLHSVGGARGGVVVKALRYKPAGHGFDSRWFHWNLSVT